MVFALYHTRFLSELNFRILKGATLHAVQDLSLLFA
jgi:hypothetical protein